MHSDRVLSCKDCHQQFAFSAEEQAFFDQMGFRHPPRRCKICRRQKKAAETGGTAVVAESGEPVDRPKRPKRRTEDRPLYPALCSECGQQTTVPFQPDPARAALCPDCYHRRRVLH